MKYTDLQRIQKIYEYGNKLYSYIESNHITKDELVQNESLQWLVTTPLYNMGEHASKLSKEYRSEHPDIPWNAIAGMRHRLVHEYGEINWNIIADTVFDEIPALLKQIAPYIKEQRD